MNVAIKKDSIIKESIIKLLEIKDSNIRITTLKQCGESIDKGIHIGGAFSAVIPLVTLYYGGFINLNIEDPTKKGQDIFILSKGHSVATMASIYSDLGYFDKSILKNSRSIESILNGHPGPILPSVHISTGPLGQGLSVAAGFAAIGKESPSNDVYCMTGDGELQEGSIWEALMYAGYKKLDNLCMIVDRNNGQLDCTEQLHIPLGNLKAKFEAFGWKVHDIDGTSYDTVYNAFNQFKSNTRDGSPTVIICNTTKGFGGFSKLTNNHKVNIPDTLLNQELTLQEERLKNRVASIKHLLDSRLEGFESVMDQVLSEADKMNLKITTDGFGTIISIKDKEPQVKTKIVPKRSKKINYIISSLPQIDKNKEYAASQIVTDTMKVFAQDRKIVSVDSDLASTSGLQPGVEFVDKTRALNVGIAEANMMCIGEAYAASGYNVWVSTFCPFFEWRVLRRIAVGYQERLETMKSKTGWLSEGHGLDITFLATAPNFETQTNGATHMGNDDITVFDGIAHLKIIDISCPQQLLGAMKWIAEGNKGLVYLRIMRIKSKVLYDSDFKFEYGKGYFLRQQEQDEVLFVSSGRGVHEAITASELLKGSGISAGVIDMPSIDEELMLSLADSGKLIIFAEQNNGYIWSSFMKIMFKNKKQVNMSKFISINTLDSDWNPRFIHSGTYEQLTGYTGLSSVQLFETVKKVLKR